MDNIDGMTLGEANWILWGLALQVGLCPTDRKPLTLMVNPESNGHEVHHCWHCYRNWFLDPDTGKCVGWLLTPSGWYYDAERHPVFREPGEMK